MPLVDRVAIVAEVYSAVCQLDSGDINALWSQSIHRYVLLYIVDNTGRHGIDFEREGLLNDLSLFSFLHLNQSFLLV